MSTRNNDRLTPELRAIESEVDHYYMNNPLIKLPFASSAWYLLAFCEDSIAIPIMKGEQLSFQRQAAIADNLVYELNYPLRWLYCSCSPGGKVPFNADNYKAAWNLKKAAWNLLELAGEYKLFVNAFTYANHDWIKLLPCNTTIQPTDNLYSGLEYEAYNRLIRRLISPYKSSIDVNSFPKDEILNTLRVENNRFTYKLNPRIVSDAIQALKPEFDQKFSLPENWKFSRYTLGEFRKVFEVIDAIANIRFYSRLMAVSLGCVGLGYIDSIYVPTHNELLRRIVRYSGISETKVLSIFDDLSYGNRGIAKPDPAIQPLIRLNQDVYAIMPCLWRFS
ncbi:MAG: hypothetical protein AAB116_00895, partial [Candidatus Poribacteria bacterium]